MNTGENYILGSMIQIKLINRWDFLNRLCIFACCNGDKLLWFPTSIFFILLPFQWFFKFYFIRLLVLGVHQITTSKQASKQTRKQNFTTQMKLIYAESQMGWVGGL